jgi:RHS repeat-associated protein/uncharacterized repeat protein (TIGR01451 family)
MKTRTASGLTTTYDWNASGDLDKVTLPSGDIFDFVYDALGNRVKTTKNGVETTYVFDGTSLVAEYNSSGALGARYLYGAGLVARQDATTLGYYDFDAAGHTRIVTSADGSVANSYEFGPFGGFVSKTESIPNRFRYVGKYGVVEDETGLFQMGTRYYDPTIGRFLSEDANGLSSGDSNPYRYGGNNPVVFIDPSGNFGFVGGTVGAVIGGSLAGITQIATNYATGQEWRTGLAGATANGAFTGAIIGATGGFGALGPLGQLLAGAAVGAGGGIAGSVAELAVGGNPSLQDAFWAAGKGAVLGALPVPGWSPKFTAAGAPRYAPTSYANTIAAKNKFGQWVWRSTIAGNLYEKLLDLGVSLGFSTTRVRTSLDPNEKVGPEGFGTEHYIEPDGTIDYTIYFENKSGANIAHAQEVVVTDVLDSDLDIATMELGEVQVGGQTVGDMIGYQTGSIRVPLKDSNLLMDVIVEFNLTTRTITWRLKAVDPLTGDFPDGVNEGILPPNDEKGSGEGHVRFRVKPRNYASQSAKIENKASIVFDQNRSPAPFRAALKSSGLAPIRVRVSAVTISSSARTAALTPNGNPPQKKRTQSTRQ